MTFGGLDDDFYDALADDDAEELYEHAPCGYLSLLPDGTIIKLNRTFSALSGYDWGDVVGRRRFSDLLSVGDRIYFETHVAPMLHMQGQVREIAADLLLHGGGRLPVLFNAVVKTGEIGEPVVVRVVVFDATERRAYEQELFEAQRVAAESEQRALALARTLQASLLPPTLIAREGVAIGVAYRPSGDGRVVGGDFYDVFETADHTLAVVIGDVAGKGAEAAVLTSLARHTIRSEALHSRDPADVLRTLAQAFEHYHPDMFCTAALVFVPSPPITDVTVAVGGHHLPIRRRADGTLDRLGEPGQILGLVSEPEIGRTVAPVVAGDTIVLYTDGVIEARRGREQFGSRRLEQVIDAAASQPPQSVAEAIVDAAVAFQDGYPKDDIAVVVLRVEPDGVATAGRQGEPPEKAV